MSNNTKAAASGRWREILQAVGIDRRLLDGKHHPCPICGGKDRFRFDDGRGNGEFFCGPCGAGQGFTLIQRLKKVDFKEAAHLVDMILGNLPAGRPSPVKPRPQTSVAALHDLWRSGRPITPEDPAGLYMAARRLTVDGLLKTLRFVPHLLHSPSRTWHPGMLAVFSDVTGKTKQFQRTYLTEQGSKADLDPIRMFTPGHLPDGGAIRLGEAAETMGVAEGVETALAAAKRFDMVVWATATEGMLQKWMPPPEARHIIVFGDNDSNAVGQCAAWTLAKRLLHEARKTGIEREVEVRIPEQPDTDWAD